MAVTCELQNLKFYNVSDTVRGQHYQHDSIEYLFDPERFVDSEIQLCLCSKKRFESDRYDLYIWRHINSNVSTVMYYSYHTWKKENFSGERIAIKSPERSYSFLGLYQRYSNADLFELADLAKKELKSDSKIQIPTLFANFFGNTIFTIFYKNIAVLKIISDMFKSMELHKENDEQGQENENLKRLYKVLALHEIGDRRMSNTSDCVKCNSILYKVLYSNERQNKEEILTIASFCS